MKKILFIFAHPDDEAFNVGGLLTRLGKNEEIETILYSATSGDAGKCGHPPICTQEELGSIRKKELHQAATLFHIDHLIVDAYHDGTLQRMKDSLTQSIEQLIDEVAPHTIVTFSNHGISMHPDHIAIHYATLDALNRTQHSVKNLYYVTYPAHLKQDRPFLEKEDAIDVILSFSEEEMQVVKEALLAHHSQHLTVERVFGDITTGTFKKYDNREYFLIGFIEDADARLENLS